MRNRAAGGLMMAVLVLALVVWPSFAEENFENPEQVVEEIKETEEPTVTPEVTVEPVVTDTPEETEQPTSTDEFQKDEEETDTDEKEEEETSAEPAEPAAPTVEPDGDNGAEASSDKGDDSITPVNRRRAAARGVVEADLSSPTVTKSEDAEYTYNQIPEDAYLSVEVAKDEYDAEKEIPSYQWYLDTEKLDGATRSRYKLSNLGVGTFTFRCIVKMTSMEDTSVSKEIASCDIKVTVKKASPKLEDFTYNIKNKVYYNAQDQTPQVTVRDGVKGMGNFSVVASSDGSMQSGVKAVGEYELRLSIQEGSNYTDAVLSLGKVTVVSIGRPTRSCSVNGTKGNKVDGVQWYKSDVTVTAPTGYLIGTEETGEYLGKREYTSEGNHSSEPIYYKQVSTGGIWGTETLPEFGIDKTAPTAELKAGSDSISLVHFFNKNQTITLEAADNISDSDNLEYYMYVSKNRPVSGSLSNVAWKEGDSVKVEDATQYYVYGKVVDEAGNVAYVSSDGIIIDAEAPSILCNGNPLKTNRTYTADEKTFSVEDENLASITYQPKNGQQVTVDVEKTNSFTLKSPDTAGASVIYTIVATDKAQNTTTETVTLVNPVPDCNIATMNFDNQIYGYSLDGLAKEPSITRSAGSNVSDLYFEKVTVLPNDEGETYFTAELDGSGRFTVTPKAGLHAGTYQNVIRVDYRGITDEEATKESATKFTCSLTVTRAALHAAYTGHTAYYHTIPDFTNYVKVNEAELKNNDTLEDLKKEEEFFKALAVEYKDHNGQNKRAMDTDVNIMPVGGSTRDYDIIPVSGTMTVVRRDAKKIMSTG